MLSYYVAIERSCDSRTYHDNCEYRGIAMVGLQMSRDKEDDEWHGEAKRR